MMILRIPLCLLALGPLAFGAGLPTSGPVGDAGSPFQDKLLVIDLDDIGFDMLAEARTPNLDFLRDNGRFYTSFMTATICSPTRAMFNTGAYPSHPDLLLGSLVPAGSFFQMPTSPLVPLATLVANHGYSTAKVGKWHLSGVFFRDHPQNCGWQTYEGSMSNVGDYLDYSKNVNGTSSDKVGIYLTTDETDDAINRVVAGVNLISLSYHSAHQPIHVPPASLFQPRPLNHRRDLVAAMVEACDTELGRLLSVALPLGYTVIVFVDNGTDHVVGGEKGRITEGGIINPMWAYGPGVEPGVDDSRVAVYDLYPTIANLFGIEAGKGSGFPLRGPDSESFIQSLRGTPVHRRFTYVDRFALFTNPRSNPINWRRVVRGDGFKYSDALGPAVPPVLWDYEANPTEDDNLFDRPLSADARAFTALVRGVLDEL